MYSLESKNRCMGSEEFRCCVTWFILNQESASKERRTELIEKKDEL